MDNSGNNKINTNIFSSEYKPSQDNPFSSNYLSEKATKSSVSSPIITNKRLNGYDSTILNKTNFEEDSNAELGIDYRIKEKQSLINELNEKIKLADTYGTQNEALGLKAKRQRLVEELNTLRNSQYTTNKNRDISKPLLSVMKEKMPALYKFQKFVSKEILSKLSKKINSAVTLSDSLEQLEEISRSVDELIDMNVPYGEKVQNYEKLTQYLNQANIIHSKISKTLHK